MSKHDSKSGAGDGDDEKYQVIPVELSKLEKSPHQPEGRANAAFALNTLKSSIDRIGLLYPPLVTRKPVGEGYNIVDGHRRIAAMAALKMEWIPVLVCEGNPDDLFRDVCQTTKGLNAWQWLDIYLKGGGLPRGATGTNIRRLEEEMGKDFLERLRAAKMSPQIWSVANRTIKYLRLVETDRPRILQWLLEHKISRVVSAWVNGDNGTKLLRDALDKNEAPHLIQ